MNQPFHCVIVDFLLNVQFHWDLYSNSSHHGIYLYFIKKIGVLLMLMSWSKFNIKIKDTCTLAQVLKMAILYSLSWPLNHEPLKL